jgi:hypothetical protein
MKTSLKIGTETQAHRIHDILFEDNDVLFADRAFSIYIRDGAVVEDITYRNNRVEVAGGLRSDKERIVDISISERGDDIWRNSRWRWAAENPGRLRSVLFEDIVVSTRESRYLKSSRIEGRRAPDNDVAGLTFRNFRVNGTRIEGASQAIDLGTGGTSLPFAVVDPETTRDIIFE